MIMSHNAFVCFFFLDYRLGTTKVRLRVERRVVFSNVADKTPDSDKPF